MTCEFCGDSRKDVREIIENDIVLLACPTCIPKNNKDDAIKLRHALEAIRAEVGTSTRAWAIANHALGDANG